MKLMPSLCNVRIFNYDGGRYVTAYYGNVGLYREKVDMTTCESALIEPEILDIYFHQPGYYDLDGNRLDELVDPEGWLPSNLHNKYKTVTMDADGLWYAWEEGAEPELGDDGIWNAERTVEKFIILSEVFNTQFDPFTHRWAKFERQEDGSWKRATTI